MRERLQPTPTPLAMALFSLFSLMALAGGGCGGVQSDREVARDRATSASCDWYQSCGKISSTDPAATYQTRSSCETQVRAQWDSGWPVADCEGKIKQSEVNTCVTAIQITDCNNGLDILNTLANKCSKAMVCSGP